MPPQPFWTSKNFYATALALAILALKLAKVWPADWDATAITLAVLAFLGSVFRWNSDAPLTWRRAARRAAMPPPSAAPRRGPLADRIGGLAR